MSADDTDDKRQREERERTLIRLRDERAGRIKSHREDDTLSQPDETNFVDRIDQEMKRDRHNGDHEHG